MHPNRVDTSKFPMCDAGVRDGCMRSLWEAGTSGTALFSTTTQIFTRPFGFLAKSGTVSGGCVHAHLHFFSPLPLHSLLLPHTAGHATAFERLRAAAVQPVLWELQELPLEAEAYMRCMAAGRLPVAGPGAGADRGLFPNVPPGHTPEQAACMKTGQVCNALVYCSGGPLYCSCDPLGKKLCQELPGTREASNARL